MTIFEDLLESNNTIDTKLEVIKDSDVMAKIVDMALMPNHIFA